MAGTNPLTVMPTMAADLVRLEGLLAESVTSHNELLTEIASHLIAAGGKRVRPGFAIAAAATASAEDEPSAVDVLRGGVAVELVHLGSLYHDDVMDDAVVRRTVDSVNARWGNHKAILAGDFLLSRASEIAASLGTEVAALLGATISRLVEGQILELQYNYDLTRPEDAYLRSIEGKTASLLSTACRIGGIVADLPRAHIEALTTFGHGYGMAFQVVDDVLDLVSSAEEMGKPTGHDMVEGVYTLPVLRCLAEDLEPELPSLLTDHMGEAERLRSAELVRRSGTIESTIDVARHYAEAACRALDELPPSSGTRGLRAAADYLVDSVEAASARQPSLP